MDTNKRTLTLAEHINKCPYDIKKKLYKILVKEERNIFDVVRLLAGGCKSLRYDLWADYMQRMPLREFLNQLQDWNLGCFGPKRRGILRELRESIGHQDDMTRWSYTGLSEADRQAIKSPLFSIIETETDIVIIFKEENLHEYCKRLPCSRNGYFPWGAFKLDIIHMILDYIVHSNYIYLHAICSTDIMEKVYTYSKYRNLRSVRYDYDFSLASDGTETITGLCLGVDRLARMCELNVQYYELMPAPIDYKHLWKAFCEDILPGPFNLGCRVERYDYFQSIFGINPPIYHTCCRKTLHLKGMSDSVAPKEYYSGDEKSSEQIRTKYYEYLRFLRP